MSSGPGWVSQALTAGLAAAASLATTACLGRVVTGEHVGVNVCLLTAHATSSSTEINNIDAPKLI